MSSFLKSIFAFALLLFFQHFLSAQCPPAAPGHYRVQKGETLYRIAKKHQITVDQLCALNGIQPSAVIAVCQELAIKPQSPTGPQPTTPDPVRPKINFQPQSGGSHRIKPGETIAGLAELYGYSEQRFRDFNGLSPSEPAWPGLVLRTSDCKCLDPNAQALDPVYVETPQPEPSTSNAPGTWQAPTFPTWEETIATNENPGYTDPGNPFGEDPFTGRNVAVYENTDGRKELPTAYQKEVDKIASPTSPDTPKKDPAPALSSDVQRSESGEDAPDKTILSTEEEMIRQSKLNQPTTAPKPAAGKGNTSYMTEEENKMVKEINLLRSFPAGYVKFVEDYRKRVAAGKAFGTVEACDELIEELKKTPPMSILQPLECVFTAAKKHGMEQVALQKGTIDHQGSDGSFPSDRIRRECPNLVLGGENLTSGYAEVRDAVLLLLVDAGIENRGHRRTLLDPTWKYVGCYKIGQVGRYPHYWVQNFGK